ncbi:MAG TPA: hypothetical protein DEB24_03460 [Coriobacteriia bacterium]|nr:hypothetical protein [Coriobacteriia bacterium]
MKRANAVVGILVVLQVIVAAVFISLMPDEVPVHMGASGAFDRIGSKYEHLILPGFSIVCAVLFFCVASRIQLISIKRINAR